MPVDTFAPSSDTFDAASHAPRRTGHGNRAGARKHAALNPTTDARPAALALAERERAAIELRKADNTYAQIATAIGYKSPAAARSAVIRGLGRWMREADEELRVLELARGDEIGQRLWPLIDDEDPHVALKAIATYLRLLDYRAKITGLYTIKPPRPLDAVAEVHTAAGEEVLANVHRFMALTNQIREENGAAMIDTEPIDVDPPADEPPALTGGGRGNRVQHVR